MRKQRKGYGYCSDTEKCEGAEDRDEDLSVLGRPLCMSFKGFDEAKLAFENGTKEVRRLLMHECSLIYECNVCRNMFRCLANFISHKRLYCRESSGGGSNGFPDQNSAIIIQTTETDLLKRSRSTGASPVLGGRVENNGNRNRDLSKVIERLKSERIPCSSKISTTTVLQLERVPTSSQAVYQTLKSKEADSIKTEVDEVHSLLTKMETVVGPDGKAITSNVFDGNYAIDDLSQKQNAQQKWLGYLICNICKLQFRTEKTLNIHVQKKHNSSTYVFQCPACSLTFLQPAAVIRHLGNDHKKSVKCLKSMRESILRRRVQLGDVQAKGPSRELKRLQLSEVVKTKGQSDCAMEPTKSTCVYCEKTFERKAALSTHLLNCRSKHEVPEKPKRLKLESPEYVAQVVESTESSNVPIKMHEEIKHDAAESESLNEMFANLGSQTFGSGLRTVSIDRLNIIDNESSTNVSNATDNTTDSKNVKETKSTDPQICDKTKTSHRQFRIVHPAKQLSCRCKICGKQFNALSNLRRHISMFHYRSGRFGCTLCDYRAFRRYDIVNHLGFVHKMTAEREIMATEYVTVHEVQYSKADVDGDIVLITDEEKELNSSKQENGLKTYERRGKRKKTLCSNADSNSALAEGDNKRNRRQRLKRSLSQQSSSLVVGMGKPIQKRPIRNRIKPVNKDFVYDLSDLINKDTQATEKEATLRSIKRRNTLFNIPETMSIGKEKDFYSYESSISICKDQVRGAARRISLLLVSDGRAASSTLPELPSERPRMRSSFTLTSRSDTQVAPIIESSDLEAARLKPTLVDDSFLEKITKHSTTAFTMKPYRTQQHSALNSLLKKVDSSRHCNKFKPISYEAIEPNSTASQNIKNVDQVGDQNHFTESETSTANLLLPPTAPKRRVTLMQRLAENQSKQRDSLLRSALEN